MLKQIVILLVFLATAVLVFYQSSHLTLAYYVLFPLLLLPVFYFYSAKQRVLLWGTVAVTLGLFGLGIWKMPSVAILLFGGCCILVLGVLVGYRELWVKRLREEMARSHRAQEDLEGLKQKHYTRLESLHRLEKQVSSLMELFEIARNFSECLSYESMTRLLHEVVMPELPFRRMRFVLLGKGDHEITFERNFEITAEEAKECPPDFTDEEIDAFSKAQKHKEVTKSPIASGVKGTGPGTEEQWIFPLVIEGEAVALVVIQGGQPEDLVRYEVLAAHLVLQVKKIRLYETVRELSIIDGLTGLYVRRHFLERFSEELRRSIKFRHPLAVLMLDIDHFKRYNDEFGHLVGDATLKEVALLLRKNLRKVDIVARYGGEEFIAVLPETSVEGANEVAERIRSGIARHCFKVYDVMAQVTVSLGISHYPNDIPAEKRENYYADLGFDLIRFADRALYRAKEEGRNRIYRYQDL